MMPLDSSHRQFIAGVLAATHDMALATMRPDGYPQTTVVSYVHDDLTLYCCIGLNSQKAHNIRQHDKVSLAITPAYQDWQHIRGLSMAGTAALVDNASETEQVADLMLFRFPQLRDVMGASTAAPWPGLVFVRIKPNVISLLNYELGFGHTELFAVS